MVSVRLFGRLLDCGLEEDLIFWIDKHFDLETEADFLALDMTKFPPSIKDQLIQTLHKIFTKVLSEPKPFVYIPHPEVVRLRDLYIKPEDGFGLGLQESLKLVLTYIEAYAQNINGTTDNAEILKNKQKITKLESKLLELVKRMIDVGY